MPRVSPGGGEAAPGGVVEAVRAFNRFYTRRIGVISEKHLDSRFSLAELRVLYELAHREAPTAGAIAGDLGLDAGYLSRILRRFGTQGLVSRVPAPDDGRSVLLRLTRQGRRAFGALEARTRASVAGLLQGLSGGDSRQLLAAMTTIERLLGGMRPGGAPFMLRPPHPGDMGTVVQRHGALYAQEYGYDWRFEALVARVVADFVDRLDPARERCWIAERDGTFAGCVFVVKKSSTVAKLRLLLVQPEARGFGIGHRLVHECVAFARQAGYRSMTLWTQRHLAAARAIYRQAGFRREHSEAHDSFGQHVVDEVWNLNLEADKP